MNVSNSSSYWPLSDFFEFVTLINDTESAYLGFSFFYIVLGTPLNLWCLAAIVSNPKLRERFRNKLLCSMYLVHLTDSMLRLPFFFVTFIIRKQALEYQISCVWFSAAINATLVQDFVANWILVSIIVLYIIQILDFNVTKYCNPLAAKVATMTVLLLPWVCSLLLIPGVMHDFHRKRKTDNATSSYSFCLYPTKEALSVFKSLDTAVPIFLGIVLLLIAAILKRRQNTGSSTSNIMETQLIGSGPGEETIRPYVIGCIVTCVCEFGLVASCFERSTRGVFMKFRLIYASYVLSDSRVLLMPLPWLMFSDIRERLKAWRPCTSHAPSDNDVTVQRNGEDASV